MGAGVSAGRSNKELVDNLVKEKYIKTETVERAFRLVDRGEYFLRSHRLNAYHDMAWKHGNYHISAPCVYSKVMEALELREGLSFLNCGSGTGYLSTMVGLILGSNGINHGIEYYEDVIKYAYKKLKKFKAYSSALDEDNFCEPKFIQGNCLSIANGCRQYDRVYCAAECPDIYMNYMKNLLKINGILVVPYEDNLLQIKRESEMTWTSSKFLPVSFAVLIQPKPNEEVIKLLDINPSSLQEQCRITIRNILRKKLIEDELVKLRISQRELLLEVDCCNLDYMPKFSYKDFNKHINYDSHKKDSYKEMKDSEHNILYKSDNDDNISIDNDSDCVKDDAESQKEDSDDNDMDGSDNSFYEKGDTDTENDDNDDDEEDDSDDNMEFTNDIFIKNMRAYKANPDAYTDNSSNYSDYTDNSVESSGDDDAQMNDNTIMRSEIIEDDIILNMLEDQHTGLGLLARRRFSYEPNSMEFRSKMKTRKRRNPWRVNNKTQASNSMEMTDSFDNNASQQLNNQMNSDNVNHTHRDDGLGDETVNNLVPSVSSISTPSFRTSTQSLINVNYDLSDANYRAYKREKFMKCEELDMIYKSKFTFLLEERIDNLPLPTPLKKYINLDRSLRN